MTQNPLQSLWREVYDQRLGFVICSSESEDFLAAAKEILGQSPDEYCLALLGQDASAQPFPDSTRVVLDQDLDGLDFVRSALRQDPDSLLLDQRAEECLPMLVQAKLTGHRVFRQSHDAPLVAFEKSRAGADPEPVLQHAFLGQELFVVPDRHGFKEVWQVQGEPDSMALVLVFERQDDGAWTSANPLLRRRGLAPESDPLGGFQPPPGPKPEGKIGDLLEQSLGMYRRQTFAPVLGAVGTSSELGHFGGHPSPSVQAFVPVCGHCDAELTLVLEVALEHAPAAFQERTAAHGLFQFFYCCSPQCSCPAAWEPFQKNSLSRIVDKDPAASSPATKPLYERLPIIEWVALNEGPAWEERGQMPVDHQMLSALWFQELQEVAYDLAWPTRLDAGRQEILAHYDLTLDSAPSELELLRTYTGDKLLGWPWWSQGVEYPHCQACGTVMEMLCQINNDGGPKEPPGCSSALGQVFAGDGNGHIYRCPTDGTMTFTWACG